MLDDQKSRLPLARQLRSLRGYLERLVQAGGLALILVMVGLSGLAAASALSGGTVPFPEVLPSSDNEVRFAGVAVDASGPTLGGDQGAQTQNAANNGGSAVAGQASGRSETPEDRDAGRPFWARAFRQPAGAPESGSIEVPEAAPPSPSSTGGPSGVASSPDVAPEATAAATATVPPTITFTPTANATPAPTSTPVPTPVPGVGLEFKGYVEAVDGSTAIIDGRTVLITPSTKFDDFHGQPLAVGQYVEVHGLLQADGSVLATKIELEDDDHHDGDELEFKGYVEAIDDSIAIIGGHTVLITPSTKFDDFHGQPLAVGQYVGVHGLLQADGSVLATKIELEDDQPPTATPTPSATPAPTPTPEASPTPSPTSTPVPTPVPGVGIEFKGYVEALDGSTAIIGGHTVLITPSTKFDDFHGQPLAVGQYVEVHGLLQADGSVLATKIELEDDEDDHDGDDLEFKGYVEALDGSTVVIGGQTVLITPSTKFDDFHGQPLAVGQYVEVHGLLQADGSVQATKIELKDDDDDHDDDDDDRS